MGVKQTRKPISRSVLVAVVQRDGMSCRMCLVKVSPETFQLDHITPVRSGGENSVENLRVVCRSCNLGRERSSLPSRAQRCCFMRYKVPRLLNGRSCIRCGAAVYLDSPTDDCGHCATCWEFHHDCRCPKAA